MKTTKVIRTRQEIDELTQEIINTSTLVHILRKDISYLYDEKEILEVCITASSSDGEDRMDAVYREFKEGGYTSYDKVFFSITYSEQYPLMMEDMNKVHNIMEIFPSEFSIKWGVGVDNSLGDQVKVVMILSRGV